MHMDAPILRRRTWKRAEKQVPCRQGTDGGSRHAFRFARVHRQQIHEDGRSGRDFGNMDVEEGFVC